LRKNLLGKIFLIIFLITLFIGLVVIFRNDSKSKAKSSGNIVILVNNIDNEIVSKERISFNKGDTLFDLISNHYDIIYDNTTYGHYLTGIKGNDFSIITDGNNKWLWFELFHLKNNYTYDDTIDFTSYNQIEVTKGIDNINLKDNMIFAINERDSTHNTSVLGKDVSFKGDNTNKILYPILITLLIISIISFIFYYVKTSKNQKKMTVKELCILVMLTAILFIQEELLVLIPSVQLTFFLIFLYGSVLGIRRGSLIVCCHTLLDNLFMSSFMPQVLLPMLLGHEVTLVIGSILKNKNEVLRVLGMILATVSYSLIFLISTVIFFSIKPIPYLISDIPFTSILILCNIISLLILYKPLYKFLNDELEEYDYNLLNETTK